MRLDHLEDNLKSINEYKKSFNYSLKEEAKESDFSQTEKRLNLFIPEKVKLFYKFSNGLLTENPNLEILELKNWKINKNNLIHFATFNNINKVYFEATKLNVADQWSIMNPKKNYILTYTMSSFWSNKIWHWLRYERIIWEDKYWGKTIGECLDKYL